MKRADFLKVFVVFILSQLVVFGLSNHKEAINRLADILNKNNTEIMIKQKVITITHDNIKTINLTYITRELKYRVKINTTTTFNKSNFNTHQIQISGFKTDSDLKSLLSELLPLINNYRVKKEIIRYL
jgi:Cu/Ag efflux protein CusF